MKPIRWAVAIVVVVLLGSGHAQEKKPEPKKLTVMQRKLVYAQKALEGLALNDFDKITTSARELTLCAEEAEWRAIKSDKYERYSNDCIRNLENLKTAAQKKNTDAAALAYVEMTLTCVKCHQYVREEKMGAAPELIPSRSTIAAAK